MPTSAAARIGDTIWLSLDRHRGILDVIELGEVALVLLYLRSRPAWEALVDGAADVEGVISADLASRDEALALLRPLLDSVRRAGEVGQLAPLVDLVNQLSPAGDVPLITQIFTAVLDRSTQLAGRKGGEMQTPESITDLAAALLDPAPSDEMFDPCCKAGGFPAAMVDRLVRRGEAVDELSIAVSDYSTRSTALAFLNLRLRGVTPQVLPGAAESLPTGAPKHQYDVVTANPPFHLSNWSRKLGGRWAYGEPPAHNSNFAWLQYVAASLNDGGRAAVVMPHGAGLSENSQERSIRGAMVNDGMVSAVIALPGQMFAATNIPVTLWLLGRSTDDRPDEVLFVDATSLGNVQDRARRAFADTDIDSIAETYHAWRERRNYAAPGLATGVSIDAIRDDGFRLNPRAHVAPIGKALDLHEQARRVAKMKRCLHRLAEQVVIVDQAIESRLKELSL